jgi:hypothetical protein
MCEKILTVGSQELVCKDFNHCTGENRPPLLDEPIEISQGFWGELWTILEESMGHTISQLNKGRTQRSQHGIGWTWNH